MPNSTKKCLTKSEISKMGPDYTHILLFDIKYKNTQDTCFKAGKEHGYIVDRNHSPFAGKNIIHKLTQKYGYLFILIMSRLILSSSIGSVNPVSFSLICKKSEIYN